MSSTTVSNADRESAVEELRKLLPVGAQVWTATEQGSSLAAYVTLYIPSVDHDGEPSIRNVTWLAADALGVSMKRGGLRYNGGGYSKSFQAVYDLGNALYRDNFYCTAAVHRCPSNDHFNDRDANYSADRLHSDAGYSLRERSL